MIYGGLKMRTILLNNGKTIGDNCTPYIIAEMNSSHNGNIETAKRMIDAAKDCGCDCVKFQSWSAESLYSDQYYVENPISKRIVKKFSLNQEQLKELVEYCRKVGIDFSSTPYSNTEVDFLADEASVPFIKIASMEINNIPFLKYIANKGVPMILSTGMANEKEIKDAVRAIESTGNKQLCILHCVSVYPAKADIINLNNIKFLRDTFVDYPIGYSDHTIGYEVAAASIALGASVVEKHFTLDNTKMGMDNNMATEPEQMGELVRACHNVSSAMGYYERILDKYEIEMQSKMRRSLVTTRDLKAGEVIQLADIEAKRPGDGISPADIDFVVSKALKRDVEKGYQLKLEYFEED